MGYLHSYAYIYMYILDIYLLNSWFTIIETLKTITHSCSDSPPIVDVLTRTGRLVLAIVMKGSFK